MIKLISDDAEFKALLETCHQFGADDDTPWLVLADWLDENGFPAQAERIRFWYQCLQPVGREAWREGARNYDLEDQSNLLQYKHWSLGYLIRSDVAVLSLRQHPEILRWIASERFDKVLERDICQTRVFSFRLSDSMEEKEFCPNLYFGPGDFHKAINGLRRFLEHAYYGEPLRKFWYYTNIGIGKISKHAPSLGVFDLEYKTARYSRAVRLEFESRKHLLTTI